MMDMSRDSVVDRHSLPAQRYVPCRQPASNVAENLGRFLVRSVQARGMTLEIRLSVEGSYGNNKFQSINNHCGVMAA